MAIREAGPSDAGAIARVHVDTWRTAYAGILPAEFLAGLSYGNSELNWSQALTANRPATCMVVAETAEGKIVGFAFGAPEHEGHPLYQGELFAIYVLQEHQRKGVGRCLFLAMVRHFTGAGMNSMLLWAFKENRPARRFYALLGGELIAEKTIAIGGTDLIEVAYGWRDLSDLAAG